MNTSSDLPFDFRIGGYYSNGAYGRSWEVRLVQNMVADPADGAMVIHYRGVAGIGRRKTATCPLEAFLTWVRYEVTLNENSWQRVGVGQGG